MFHPGFYRSMDIGVNIRVEEKVMAQVMAIYRRDSYGIYPKTCNGVPLPHDSGANICKFGVLSCLQRRIRVPFFLGFDAASLGKWFPTFPRKVSYSSLRCTFQGA
jgi:hypothetical protein